MKRNSAILGAAFLMATSAIGPGFLTQTTVFTAELLTSFGFVILISVLIDICAQVNIWRVISISGSPAQELANRLLPGLGYILAAMIAIGGFIFNIGNIGGAGLGWNILTGMDTRYGAVLSALIAIGIFWVKEAGVVMDRFTQILGLLMIGITVYIAFASHPPVIRAIEHSFFPEKTRLIPIITLVGGTVGGYISFAGAHRLLDAGIRGPAQMRLVTRSAISGILITSFMRFILFLAVLGVVSTGFMYDQSNPTASVFQKAAGQAGYFFFGIVLWIASITSVIGASYTTVSFWKTLVPAVNKHSKWVVTVFILLSTLIFLINPHPVKLLLFAGTANGFILPIALAIVLLAVYKKHIMGEYKHPLIFGLLGWMTVALMLFFAVRIFF